MSTPSARPQSSGSPGSADNPRLDAAVVFLHGQPGAGSDWDAVAAILPTRIRSLAPDRPGYRTNPRPPGGFDDNARWVLDVLDTAGLHDAVLVGHSYGGGVALAAAALAPERVRGLILLASVGPECLDGWDPILAAPITGPICAVSAWWLTPWFARRRLAWVSRRELRPLQSHEHLNLEAWGSARHEHGAMWRTFLTEQRELVHHLDTLEARLGQTQVPALVIADPADKMIPVATARALAAALPQARLVLVPEGGHHLPRRNPQAVADEVLRFIDSL
jgi:pimeloyl-ACP methyl ester carboxylesterase